MRGTFSVIVDAARGKRFVAIEGVYGAGKSTLIGQLAANVSGLSVCPDYLMPTEYLDDPVLGQAIYPLHDCLKCAFAESEVSRAGQTCVVERYMLSTMAHHYADPAGRFEEIGSIFDRLLRSALIRPPELTIIVLRDQAEVLRVNAARQWDISNDFLARQDFFYRHVAPEMKRYAAELRFYDGGSNIDSGGESGA